MSENNAVAVAANSAALAKLNGDWMLMIQLGKRVADTKIKFVNLGREIGLGLQGLCGHEQIKLSFYEHIKESLPAGFTFVSAQKCIQLAHALPEPALTVEEANRVESQLLFGCGLMDLPHRDGAQNHHGGTPDTEIFSILASATDKLFKQFKSADQWDNETRSSIAQQVAKFEKALAEIKGKLNLAP